MLKPDLIQYCKSDETVTGILGLFTEDFLSDFELLLEKRSIPVMKAIPYLYRMWYYSTLIEDTPLSPANFINSQAREMLQAKDIIVPIALPKVQKNLLKDFSFEFKIFNIDDHPILEDLKLFIEQCTPDIGVDEQGLLLEEERNKFIDMLTFKEIFYITYLTNVSYELKLLRKMPSIGVHRSTPVQNNAKAFFKLAKEEQLEKIIDATLSTASKNLSNVFTIDRKPFSKESLSSLLNNAADMNKFVDDIYKKFNLSIDDLNLEELDFDTMEDFEDLDIPPESLMAMTMRMDIEFLIDAYLLTPFGYYLQLIQPIFINKINFHTHFEELQEAYKLNLPLIKLFFRMPSGFDITPLGEHLLLKGKIPKDRFQNLRNNMDYNKAYKEIVDYNSGKMLNEEKSFNEEK